jgi:hypothetical protein
MGCILVIIGLLMPRVILAVLWAFTDYTKMAFQGYLWPILGFLFMPFTTLAYLVAKVNNGAITGWWIVLMVFAVLLDLSSNTSTANRNN